MFQSLFSLLMGAPLPRGAAITGIKLVYEDGEEAFLKIDGVPDADVARAIGQMRSRGWKVVGVFTTLDVLPRDGFKPIAAYLRA